MRLLCPVIELTKCSFDKDQTMPWGCYLQLMLISCLSLLFLKYLKNNEIYLFIQDHKGISNAAPADCPLIPLLVPKGDQFEGGAEDKTRIHDHISNLKFSISPTAFFQVCS